MTTRDVHRQPLNPLLLETLRGLAASGPAHLEYLLYLFWQAVVLFVWWPKDTLSEALAAGDRPDTLLASLAAAGIAAAWYAARAGAGEILLPGQAHLAQWTLDTHVPLPRILAGYLAGHLVQTLGLVALSAPLVACGYGVSGGRPGVVAWSLTAVVFQATLFRLLAAAIHLAIGHRQTMTLVCVRGAVVVAYLASLLAAPAVSHVAMSAALLERPAPGVDLDHPGVQFLLWSAAACAVVLLVLARQLRGLRAGAWAAR